MRKRFLIGGLVLVVVATAFVGITFRAGTARAAAENLTGTADCARNATSMCLDLQNDKFVGNNPIILYSYNSTEERFRWNNDFITTVKYNSICPACSTPFKTPSLDQRYNGDNYYYIEKSTATGHDGCMAINSTLVLPSVAWETCDQSPYTQWVWSSTEYLVNVGVSDNSTTWGGNAGDPWLLEVAVKDGTSCNPTNASSSPNLFLEDLYVGGCDLQMVLGVNP
jgi:hypothetical protein